MLPNPKDTLLIVGDAQSEREELREQFESAYNILEAESPQQATMLLEQNMNFIAAILVDVPVINSREVHKLMNASRVGTPQEVPVIFFIQLTGTGVKEDYAFALGAADVVFKPYSKVTVQHRVQRLVDLYIHKQSLEELVEEQTAAIRNTNQVMLDTLSSIIEHRNTESGKHVLRIRRFTQVLLNDIAQCYPEYGLTESIISTISSAAALHDLGKIAIPDSILNKPGKLTPEEYEVMKTHTTVGAKLVEQLSNMGDLTFLRYAHNIALYHHERYDGSGYPCGLSGEDIPICAQAVGLADAFDALTTVRSYKPALSCEVAYNMIIHGECGRFSPRVLECFKYVKDEFFRLAQQYSDREPELDEGIFLPNENSVQRIPTSQLQILRTKYFSLLHYINDTVIELDLTDISFHVVYNPNPDLDLLNDQLTFEQLIVQLAHGVNPEETDALNYILSNYSDEGTWARFRKRSFPCDLPSNYNGSMIRYELTIIRVNTDATDHRLVMVILHKDMEPALAVQTLSRETLASNHILRTLTSCVLRTAVDGSLTMNMGIENLQPLTGYTRSEIGNLFNDSLLEMILTEDRTILATRIQDAVNSGRKRETEVRICCKNNSTLWVLCKSRILTEADGREYIYHTLTDIAYVKERQAKLEQDNIRSQLIIDQTGGITFEWDLIRDVLMCSDKFGERFGYPPVSTDFSARLYGANHIHPDDLPQLREQAEALESGEPIVDIDIRISTDSGRYQWSKIRAANMYNEKGLPVRVVGIITDIDDLKKVSMSFKDQAERDSLTRLYNKSSTHNFVDIYLEQREPIEMAAMLLLDLDNFKRVNDSYGHLYGDAVLTQIGIDLRKMFRSEDIIGRIGGDEFLVLLRNIHDRAVVGDRCEELLATFNATFDRLMPGLGVGLSIGCAMIPEHGTTYNELFQHADSALYSVKGRTKGTYVIYDPREQYNTLLNEVHTTRVDSDEEPGFTEDKFMRLIFHRLYQSNNISQTIKEILAFIGGQFNVSRVYIFENFDDNKRCKNTFEWCNAGITPEIDNLQDLSYETDIPGWESEYDENGIFYCTDIKLMKPNYRAVLEPQGIKSILICSIMDGDRYCGFVGFDECTGHRFWTKSQIDLLAFLAEVMGVFLIKLRTQENHQLPPRGAAHSITD